jgi:hypothetical protein
VNVSLDSRLGDTEEPRDIVFGLLLDNALECRQLAQEARLSW